VGYDEEGSGKGNFWGVVGVEFHYNCALNEKY
jgi:hypothetical protein